MALVHCLWTHKVDVTAEVSLIFVKSAATIYVTITVSTISTAAFVCTSQQPWAVNDNLAYGFAAAKLSGIGEWDWCCACYELTFTSGPVNQKKMVVQVTNTGGDLGVSDTTTIILSQNTNEIGLLFLFYLQIGKSFRSSNSWWRCRPLQWLPTTMGSSISRMGR